MFRYRGKVSLQMPLSALRDPKWGSVVVGCAACMLVGCSGDPGGLELDVEIPPAALAHLTQLVITLDSSGAPFAMRDDTVQAGVTVHAEGGRAELTLDKSRFALAPSFGLRVQPTAGPLSVAVTAAMYDGNSALGATNGPVSAVLADAHARVRLVLSCADPDCSVPTPANVVDLANPNPTQLVAFDGSAAGDDLIPLAVGHFGGTSALVAVARGRNTVYLFKAQLWSVAGFPAQFDSTFADLYITGPPGETLGDAAAVGDVDGDGLDDLVLTATNGGPPGGPAGTGVAYVLTNVALGSLDRRTLNIGGTGAPAAGTGVIYGGGQQEGLGTAVALGRISTSSASDILLGAPGAPGAAGTPGAGRVYAVFGGHPPRALVMAGSTDPAVAVDATVLGHSANLPIGYALAAGDLLGDSKADVAIGNPSDLNKQGVVYVLSGARFQSGAMLDLGTDFDARVLGVARSQLGSQLLVADLDGNGTHELVATARGSGVVYVTTPVLGQASDLGLGQYALAYVSPGEADFGSALAVGNLDGDAAADLIIGSPSANGIGGMRPGAGAGYVWRGAALGGVVAGRAVTQAGREFTPSAIYLGAVRQGALGGHVVAGDLDTTDQTDEIMLGAAGAASDGQGIIYGIANLPAN
jgi:hypothetical protein